MSRPLVWRHATDIGARKENEDHVVVRQGVTLDPDGDHPVAVVCDGLGGHGNGAIAADNAARAFMEVYVRSTAKGGHTVQERLLGAVEAANAAVHAAIVEDPKLDHMATTLTAAAVTRDGLEWVNVGDSPLYLVDTGKQTAKLLSVRHNAPHRPHILTSAILGGTIDDISSSHGPIPLETGQLVVIASDGLDTLPPDEIAAALATPGDSGPAQVLIDRTLDKARTTGKKRQDNVTAAVLDPADLAETTGCENAILGFRRPDGEVEVAVDGKGLDWWQTLAWHNHSPSGPEWGYAGSGPAQLALAILGRLAGRDTALRHYHAFKDEWLTPIETDEWRLEASEAPAWLHRLLRAPGAVQPNRHPGLAAT
ncbi:MAG: protein phosphatase 2C domain-containing protein, partial [Acidobacteria bacterium]|nr:protein phosphatase 2C domain-containing protein [Acidobacteriota bacterium]